MIIIRFAVGEGGGAHPLNTAANFSILPQIVR